MKKQDIDNLTFWGHFWELFAAFITTRSVWGKKNQDYDEYKNFKWVNIKLHYSRKLSEFKSGVPKIRNVPNL